MLHDGMLTSAAGTQCEAERRRSDRLPFPGEVVILWHHDLETMIRYRIVDAGDGGFRIVTATPILEGMTGMAVKLLPGGQQLDRPIMVGWLGEPDERGEREVGLRYF